MKEKASADTMVRRSKSSAWSPAAREASGEDDEEFPLQSIEVEPEGHGVKEAFTPSAALILDYKCPHCSLDFSSMHPKAKHGCMARHLKKCAAEHSVEGGAVNPLTFHTNSDVTILILSQLSGAGEGAARSSIAASKVSLNKGNEHVVTPKRQWRLTGSPWIGKLVIAPPPPCRQALNHVGPDGVICVTQFSGGVSDKHAFRIHFGAFSAFP
jgi:hypothetical protein